MASIDARGRVARLNELRAAYPKFAFKAPYGLALAPILDAPETSDEDKAQAVLKAEKTTAASLVRNACFSCVFYSVAGILYVKFFVDATNDPYFYAIGAGLTFVYSLLGWYANKEPRTSGYLGVLIAVGIIMGNFMLTRPTSIVGFIYFGTMLASLQSILK